MKSKPDVSRKPGQHEDLLAGVARIEAELKKPHPVTVNVNCSCCADTQREILVIVKDIQKRLQDGGISAAEEAELARRLKVGKDSLKGAVEANTPLAKRGAD